MLTTEILCELEKVSKVIWQKCRIAPSRGTHGSLDIRSASLPNRISISSAVFFAQLTCVPNTQKNIQTHRPTSVAIGRIYALHAGDAA